MTSLEGAGLRSYSGLVAGGSAHSQVSAPAAASGVRMAITVVASVPAGRPIAA